MALMAAVGYLQNTPGSNRPRLTARRSSRGTKLRKTTHIAALSAFVSLFCASVAIADQAIHDTLPENIRSAGVIRIGGAFESFPQLVAHPNEATKPVGIAADLAALLAPVLGVKIEWVNTHWPGQIPGLQAGSLDALMGQISVTAERERKMLDFVPYFQASAGIVVPNENPRNIGEDVKTLCGLKIGAPSGSLYGQTLRGISEKYCTEETAGPITLAEFPSAPAASTAVLSGQIDGYLDSSVTCKGIASSSGARLSSISLLYNQTQEWDPGLYGIAFTKDNVDLTKAVLLAMKAISETGQYQQVLTKYNAGDSAVPADRMSINPLTHTPVGQKQ